MEFSLDPWALGVIFFGIAVGAFFKGLTGMGLPLVATPFMAGFLGAEHAIVVMQIPGMISNGWLAWTTRHAARELPLRVDMVLPALAMILVGVWFLEASDNRTIVLLLAGAVAAFLALLAFNPSFRLTGARGRAVTVAASLFGGFTQGATGVSGPLFSTLIFSFRPGKDAFVFCSSFLFGAFHVLQFFLLTAFGLVTWQRLAEGLVVVVPMLAFQYLGMRLRGAVSLKFFNIAVFAMIVVMEIKLLWQGLGG